MDKTPKFNTEDELLGDALGNDSSAAKPISFKNEKDVSADIDKAEHPEDDTDKYLALEQPGVSYTEDTNPTENSDFSEYDSNDDDEWSEEGGNSKNSDAFNQDDYMLEDNIDLDEDQNQSISSDDEDFEESNERYTN
ncbi:hypothetical protein [Flavobacterium psychrotrophum]|uniref:hypothetical protein n=1 Tax=Flavobacterium psychrotrophum TaxID=2294119 RepID=UPI000E318DD4|nr:hypothetical protein [Flavobacterium psychrotrophum]